MKQAFLITAYKDFETLYGLAEYYSKAAYVYIHVDAKSSEITEDEIKKLNTINRCHTIRKYRIAWGGFAHISAILELMQLALENKEVTYLHLLTGQDIPLHPVEELAQKYVDDEHIYMDCIPQRDFTIQVTKRLLYHNWFADKNVKNPILWQLQNLSVELQRLLGVKRKKLGEFRIEQVYKGLVYISMPREAAYYVLDYCIQKPEFLQELKDTQIPEEFFFQTIFMNSDFASKVIPKSIRYMNWEKGDGGSPSCLDMTDYDAIRNGDYDFARKYDKEYSKELIEHLLEK